MKVLMCVPNISEGTDREKVEEIVHEIKQSKQVILLDHSSDPNHNRSVITYLGEPEPILEATKKMAAKAFELIDMTKHKGSHPRIGAVDVVPFIPIRNIEIQEAIGVAVFFGKYVGSLGIPVYYHEEAATKPNRARLAWIRKGEYEGLEAKLKDPEWQPDEGPTAFNPKSGIRTCFIRGTCSKSGSCCQEKRSAPHVV